MGRSIAARLDADDSRAAVTAFPDGSVDVIYDVIDGDNRIDRRDSFVDTISASRSPAVTLRQSTVEPGGHVVNMARQASQLGNEVTLVGHLDHPILADLPFDTISMGAPSRVNVHRFDDGDVLTVEPSADVMDWTLADFTAATADAFEPLLTVDLVFCSNWRSFDAIPAVLADIADRSLDGELFLIDPGRVSDRPDREVQRLIETLAALDDSFDVVLASNGTELRSIASALGGDAAVPDEVGGCLDRIRAEGELHAAVVHEVDRAVAATQSERIYVENFDVEAVRHTGGGDRFDAGLGHALVRDWSWRDALRLANACAAAYVASGDTMDRIDLAAFLRERQ